MSKEYLEALNWLLANERIYRGKTRLPISPSLRFSIEALQRLESIDNAEPSEALESLEVINNYGCGINDNMKFSEVFEKEYNSIKQALLKAQAIKEANPNEALELIDNIREYSHSLTMVNYLAMNSDLDTVKEYILKAQEQEKENVYIEKIKTMMKQKDCVLRYIESEDCFAVKTILSDGWYKLTPEFVENNVREEIKPLPLIEKNKQLKEENAELKKVLDVINEYVMPLVSIDDECVWDNEGYRYRVPKKEELELLKRYFE